MNKILQAIIASTLAITGTAHAEQPLAEDLVGKFYGGIHAGMMSADDDRLTNGSFEDDDNRALGLEAGYRWTEAIEVRLSYTDLSFDLKDTSDEISGDALSFDALYFPNKKNIYLLAGLNALDIINTQTSANAGLGYRYYFTKSLATYAEAKAHYQFSDNYLDYSAQVGLVYFFGGKAKPAAIKTAPTVAPVEKEIPLVESPVPEKIIAPTVVATTLLDSDNDGITDAKDKCAETPIEDKVDEQGCTVFAKEKLTQRLLVTFENNKADINQSYYPEIEKAALFLTKYPHTNLTIAGHSSAQGGAAFNLSLSQKRADAIVEVLVTKFGINKDRLTAIGYGETKLLNTENTAAAHKENRRIEAVISIEKEVRVAR